MKLRRIETPAIAHYAYLIADGGEAAIVDPRRDVEEYLRVAQSLGVRIRYIIETHRQEDFVMGSAHLAELTGAEVVNGTHDCFGRGDVRLDDGDEMKLGSVTIRALHTPGHTPESMSYALFANDDVDDAWGVLTGDTLFYGDTGRTDLPDKDRQQENAGLIYDSVYQKIAPLGDAALVLPTHGPGSVCGSGMADLPWSTLGAERVYNRVFTCSRGEFIEEKGSERLPRPPYFRRMEEVNLRGGLPPRKSARAVTLESVKDFAAKMSDGAVIDTRSPEAFAGGHIADAYSVWQGGLSVFGGWVADHETPLFLVTDTDEGVATATELLARIGLDEVRAGLAGGFGSWRASGWPIARSGVITPRELAERRKEIAVLDVRDADEFAGGHIPEAKNIYVGHLAAKLGKLDLDRSAPVAVTCGVGHRAGVAVSVLLRAGFQDVRNLLGGMKAWNALGLATEKEK